MEFKIEQNITIDQIRALKPKMIYYGARTCWWTHDAAHLGKTPPLPENFRPKGATSDFGAGIPCDPRGGVLFQTEDVEGFLSQAENNASKYGENGIAAFIASHHLNCKTNKGDHTCFTSFQEYNNIINAQKDN